MTPPPIETSTPQQRREWIRKEFPCISYCENCGLCQVYNGRDAADRYAVRAGYFGEIGFVAYHPVVVEVTSYDPDLLRAERGEKLHIERGRVRESMFRYLGEIDLKEYNHSQARTALSIIEKSVLAKQYLRLTINRRH